MAVHIANVLLAINPTWQPPPAYSSGGVIIGPIDLPTITQYADAHIDTTLSWGPGLGDAKILRPITLTAP